MPTLHVFAISHFCEKARWALDDLGIAYELSFLAPGPHRAWSKRNGLPESTLPVLDTGSELIQGSAAIIDWADAHTELERTLTPPTERDACLEIERRLDERSGVHTRRMFYSEALIEHPATVRRVFTADLSGPQRMITTVTWPIVRRLMARAMDVGPEQGEESHRILEAELDWLDGLFADGRRYLVGGVWTRADLAFSSLYSRAAGTRGDRALPPRLDAVAKEWAKRPTFERVRANYRDHRETRMENGT